VKAGASEETLPEKHGFDEVAVSENEGIAEGWYFHPYLFNKDIKKKLPGDREYITDRQNVEAVEFIDRNRDKPFFLYLSHYAVHTTVHGKPDLVDHFRKKKGAGTSPPTKNNPENDLFKRWPADSRAKANNPHLAAQLYVVDEGIGMIKAKLKELGLDKNTIIVFTSDNGGETTITTNAPLKGGKSMLYEGGLTEPCIVWAPGLFKPAVINEAAVNLDFYPTFMDLIKAKPNQQKVDGVSLNKVLNGTGRLTARNFYWHYPLNAPHFLGGRSAGSIISGDWKLIEFFDDKSVELYNLKQDIAETNNLAIKNPLKVKEMLAGLEKWRKNVGAE
jgi:arylsulfatase A-like enzyme